MVSFGASDEIEMKQLNLVAEISIVGYTAYRSRIRKATDLFPFNWLLGYHSILCTQLVHLNNREHAIRSPHNFSLFSVLFIHDTVLIFF